MVLAQMLLAACFGAAGVLAPVVAPALGYTTAALGPYAGVFGVAVLAGGTLIDGVLRRHGGARTLQISALVSAAGVLLAASASLPLVGLSSIVLGFGGGMTVPAAIHVLAHVTPPERLGIVFAVNQCGVPAGFGLAGVVFPLLLRVTDWRMSLVLLAAALVLIILIIQPMRAALDAGRDPRARLGGKAFAEPLRMAWNEPRLRLLGWLTFSLITVQMAMQAYLVSYLHLGLGFTHLQAGAAFLVSQVAAVVTRLFLGWLLDKVGRYVFVLGILGLGSGLSALWLCAVDPDWSYAALLAVSAVTGGFMSGWNAVYFAAVSRAAPPGRAGTAVGGTQIFTSVGAIVGPLIVSAVLSASGSYAAGFSVVSVFAVVIGLRLLWMERQTSRPARVSP